MPVKYYLQIMMLLRGQCLDRWTKSEQSVHHLSNCVSSSSIQVGERSIMVQGLTLCSWTNSIWRIRPSLINCTWSRQVVYILYKGARPTYLDIFNICQEEHWVILFSISSSLRLGRIWRSPEHCGLRFPLFDSFLIDTLSDFLFLLCNVIRLILLVYNMILFIGVIFKLCCLSAWRDFSEAITALWGR